CPLVRMTLACLLYPGFPGGADVDDLAQCVLAGAESAADRFDFRTSHVHTERAGTQELPGVIERANIGSRIFVAPLVLIIQQLFSLVVSIADKGIGHAGTVPHGWKERTYLLTPGIGGIIGSKKRLQNGRVTPGGQKEEMPNLPGDVVVYRS